MLATSIGIVASALIAVLVAGPGAPALKKHPWAFYLGALLLTGAYVVAHELAPRNEAVRFLIPFFQKGYLSVWLLAIVMATGVFDEGTALRRHLQPVRAELSILSFILILGHLYIYLEAFLPRLAFLLGANPGVGTSLVLAIVLAALFLLLTATSFKAVRAKMGSRAWKNLQRLSYAMVALLFAHVGFVLGGAAFGGRFTMATLSVIVYGAAIAVYAVLRCRKALADKKRRAAREEAC